ncbi:MAG: lysylphosphatidylglycerol synthase transmembrane domain-containing protein [Isosphaeraceae bacterium]|nr:lysylphosphatidylglycerol synthase transmembrane domain-containing protein [Isosphaeraceae bacterium]
MSSSTKHSPPAAPANRKRRGLWKPAVKVILTLIVLAAAGRHVSNTWDQLREGGRAVAFEPWRLAGAAVVYAAGLGACAIFFARVLAASGRPIPLIGAVRAYFISHLGKYVPGKALVVVMRAGLAAPWGAGMLSSVTATFYETFVMMAAGGLIATIGFTFGASDVFPVEFAGYSFEAPLWLLGLGATIVFLVVVDPRLFPLVGRRLASTVKSASMDEFPRIDFRLLFEGLALMSIAWLLLGLSQVLVLSSMGVDLSVGTIPRVIASVALATVAGFAVPISPGGLGVREWVLWTALGSSIDRDLAVVAALALRLVWFAAELAAAAALAPVRPQGGPPISIDPRPSDI